MNGKTNQHGHIDEFSVIRNRVVDFCPVGAVVFIFFVHFHVLRKLVPNFAPDLNDASYGMYGKRDWYDHYLFQSDPDKTVDSITYDGEFIS